MNRIRRAAPATALALAGCAAMSPALPRSASWSRAVPIMKTLPA